MLVTSLTGGFLLNCCTGTCILWCKIVSSRSSFGRARCTHANVDLPRLRPIHAFFNVLHVLCTSRARAVKQKTRKSLRNGIENENTVVPNPNSGVIHIRVVLMEDFIERKTYINECLGTTFGHQTIP
ncbi:hypothetical protein BD410DRAFT_791267 [Rickenella mellea]|uniref:Uncharacterized protein n=1 Tax=Rickenella mellea TaxID=50990 RepID=A0A4Y7PXP8_9AGAM|nr:hypothetical protein BD410DRAFT_791267 [Rickenella mellea]